MKKDKKRKMKIMVSACLAGENCKYNGGNNRNEIVLKLMADNEVITVCPEQMGGLPTPRVPSEIRDGLVWYKLEGLERITLRSQVVNVLEMDLDSETMKLEFLYYPEKEVISEVSKQNADEGNARKIVSLGYHLCAEQNISLFITKITEHFVI